VGSPVSYSCVFEIQLYRLGSGTEVQSSLPAAVIRPADVKNVYSGTKRGLRKRKKWSARETRFLDGNGHLAVHIPILWWITRRFCAL